MIASFRIGTSVLSLTIVFLMAILAIRGLINPVAGAEAFGLPAADASAAFYHAIYRDRNLVIAVIALIYIFARMWRAFAILVTVALTLPAYDVLALVQADIPVLPVHVVTLAALSLLCALVWVRVVLDAKADALTR